MGQVFSKLVEMQTSRDALYTLSSHSKDDRPQSHITQCVCIFHEILSVYGQVLCIWNKQQFAD